MPRLHLTNIAVQRLSTIGIYYDTTTPAFGIRVGKHRKAWVITQGTDRQRISIGHYPSMSLAEARKEAKKRLANELVKGARLSFSEAYGQYKLVIAGKKPRTQKTTSGTSTSTSLPNSEKRSSRKSPTSM